MDLSKFNGYFYWLFAFCNFLLIIRIQTDQQCTIPTNTLCHETSDYYRKHTADHESQAHHWDNSEWEKKFQKVFFFQISTNYFNRLLRKRDEVNLISFKMQWEYISKHLVWFFMFTCSLQMRYLFWSPMHSLLVRFFNVVSLQTNHDQWITTLFLFYC